jgi:hypothetical protein
MPNVGQKARTQPASLPRRQCAGRISARSSAIPSPVTADVEIKSGCPTPRVFCEAWGFSPPFRSDLILTKIAGRPSASPNNSASSSVSPCDASSTTSTRSASASASIDFRIPIDSASSSASRMPAVSTSLTGNPPNRHRFADQIARRPRSRRHDGPFALHQPVEQTRFAHVRPANNCQRQAFMHNLSVSERSGELFERRARPRCDR